MENKKYISMKNWTLKDYNKNAITAFLGGIVANMSGIILVEIIGGVLILTAIILEAIYWYKRIKEKKLYGNNEQNAFNISGNRQNIHIGEKIKNYVKNLNNYKYVIFIILILGTLFYWYQIRPSRAYTYCHDYVLKNYGEYNYDHYYQSCLNSRGLR